MGRPKGSKNKYPKEWDQERFENEVKGNQNPRSRGWALTINNWQPHHIDIFKRMYEEGKLKYIIYGQESGHKTGTPHLQVFIIYKDQVTFTTVKGDYPDAHIEPQKSSNINNILYCMKDDKYTEIGDRPHQGKRSDLDAIYKDIKNGKTMLDIAREYPVQYSLFRRSFDAYAQMEHDDKGQGQTKLCLYITEREFDVMQKVMKSGKVKYLENLGPGYYQGEAFLSSSCYMLRSTLMYHLCKGTFTTIYVSDNSINSYELLTVRKKFSNVEIYRWCRENEEFEKEYFDEENEDL